MAEAAALKPRHPLGLIAIALFLGPPALMLWMGRFWLSIAYMIAGTGVLLGVLYFYLNDTFPGWLVAEDSVGWSMWILAGPFVLVSIVHAFRLNRLAPLRPWYSRWFVALPAHLLASYAIALLVRTLLFQPFYVPSSSNHPNLVVADFFFVSKRAYNDHDPLRGDIAVFKLPTDPAIDYVKRVVGLPGDRIQMKNGVLYINGVPVKLEPTTLDPIFTQDENGNPTPIKFYRETLPEGRSYVIADSGKGDLDDTEEFIVPADHYFTIGDNRDNSMDSRILSHHGYVPRENFIGPFLFRFWNSTGFPMTGRPAETYGN